MLQGEIDGAGNLAISGSKVKMLAEPADGGTFDPTVTVGEGEYEVTSTTVGNITLSGGVLKGSSDLLGNIVMSDGSIAPGLSPGCIGSTGLTFTGGSYDVELGGTTACTEYDQISVTGAVDLGSSTDLNISVISSYEPAVNDVFAIVLNDGTDAVSGEFVGWADGDNQTVAGYTYQINYDAGDGNDVVLSVLGTPSAPYTGVGTVLSSPIATLFAAMAVAGVIFGFRYLEGKRN